MSPQDVMWPQFTWLISAGTEIKHQIFHYVLLFLPPE